MHCVVDRCSTEAECAPLYDCLSRVGGPLSLLSLGESVSALTDCLMTYFGSNHRSDVPSILIHTAS